MPQRQAIAIFCVFAFAYFLSSLIRAITATLAPTLVQDFALNARDLGLLAGGYFLGFAATQLPLGAWLDRLGPKRVVLAFLSIAVLGCLAFAAARSFGMLLAARILCGVGVSACLMAPLTGYRRWYAPASQMRANSWMLMVGAFGMVASTLPVQWLLPAIGWRMVFVLLAVLVALAMALIAWQAPAWQRACASPEAPTPGAPGGYVEVWRNAYFRRLVPLGFFNFGGLVAMQTLWAAPWMVHVAQYSPLQAATGLFGFNAAMLGSFWLWGLANPWLSRRGYTVDRLLALGVPISLLFLAILVMAGEGLGAATAVVWTMYGVGSTVAALAQPAVGMAFPPTMAGRALSAYNLVIFCGVFTVQWGVGLLIDGLRFLGCSTVLAYQGAIGMYAMCCIGAYVYFLWVKKP